MVRIAELRGECARHLTGMGVYRRAARGIGQHFRALPTSPATGLAAEYKRQAHFNLDVARSGREAAVAHGWRLP